MENNHPVILTIATTDSGGGAGIQADLKTMTVLGAFGTSVAVALTAQNGAEVLGIHGLDSDFVRLQYEAVKRGFPVKAAKLGMLYSAELIETVADLLKDKEFPLVVDPVCVSESGYKLLQDDAVEVLKEKIIPLADLFTPNRPEAELLASMEIKNSKDAHVAGQKMLAMGAKAVLVKGGHFEEDEGDIITDWLALPGKDIIGLPHARIYTENKHGTGCTLSAAIASYLGFGFSLEEAIIKAQDFLVKALASSYPVGKGPGAPNFLGGI